MHRIDSKVDTASTASLFASCEGEPWDIKKNHWEKIMNGSSKLYTSADGRTFVEVLKDPNKKGSRMTGQSFSLLKKVRLACTQRMRYRIDLPIVLSCMVSFAASHPEFLDWAVSKGVPQARTETL